MPIPSPLSRPSPSREDVTSPSSTAGGGGSLVALLSDISEGPTFSEPFEKFQSPICSDDEDDFLDDEEWFESEAILFDISDLLRPDSRAEVLKEIRNRMKAHLTPKRILLRDKITFTLGTLDLFLSAYWLGHSPETYGLQLYSVKVCVLLLTRWIYYRSKRWHYYFFDLCYFAQTLLLVQLHLFPTNITLAKVCFAFSLGPLLWSIVAFRNSLVYHSLDKVTSLFLHFFPATVCFAYRWHPPPAMATALASDPEMKARWDEATLWELCLLPMGPYVAWALLYYLKVFVISSKKISDKGYETLFSWMTSKKGGFASLVLRFPRPMQPLAYISMHFALTLAAMSVNVLWWSNQSACSAVIVGAFAVAAWNGASFYFEVFLHRYLAGLGMEQRRQQSKSPAPASAVSQAGQDVTSRPKGE